MKWVRKPLIWTSVVGRINRVNRIERWVYAGLHTFDLPFLYDRRPLWTAPSSSAWEER